jgi:Fe-S-cluster containining protein
VSKSSPIQICVGEEPCRVAPGAEVRLEVLGRPITVRFWAAECSAHLTDLVSPAMELSSSLADAAMSELSRSGQAPPCRRGCSACCRFLVPVSGVEALWLWEQTATLSEPRRRRLLRAHAESGRRILEAAPRDKAGAERSIEEVARWYERLQLDCPFLAGDVCSAYSRRPLACREFLAYCALSRPQAPARFAPGLSVTLPVSPAAALGELAEALEPRWPRAIVLPLALAWAADPSARPAPRQWPAALLAGRFAEILRRQALSRAA